MVMKVDSERGVKIDTSKAQKKFSQESQQESNCVICNSHVYQVEKINAEKKVFHKQCFRCKQCNKQLNMDSYNSHEGQLYCQIHFKQLLRPKPVVDNRDDLDLIARRQRSVIIRESIPQELPADVIRSDSKVDDGLDSIHLDLSNLRQRFELSKNQTNGHSQKPLGRASPLQKSDSILARLQKYESAASGMDQDKQQPDQSSDGEQVIDSPSEPLSFAALSNLKTQWEQKAPAESSTVATDANPETKEELASLRQRIGVGRSASLRQMYEQQKEQNLERPNSRSRDGDGDSGGSSSRENAESMRRRFEQGEFESEHDLQYRERLRRETQEELHLVQEAETAAKEAKQIFHRLDKMQLTTGNKPTVNGGHSNNANVSNGHSQTNGQPTQNGHSEIQAGDQVDSESSQVTARPPFRRILSVPEQPTEVIKGSEPGAKELPQIDTAQLQERYRFFERQASGEPEEQQKKTQAPPPKPIELPRKSGDESHVVETPADRIQRDPNVIRSSDVVDDRPTGETTRRMLDVFKRMEKLRDSQDDSNTSSKPHPPLRCITPPAEYTVDDEESIATEQQTNGQSNGDLDAAVKSPVSVEPEKARTLKAKFENWAGQDNKENNRRNTLASSELGDEVPQLDITKNLRQKFESFSEVDSPKPVLERTKGKVHRFVSEFGNTQDDKCCICSTKIYPMEKLEFSNMKLHRTCFRCCHCTSSLRLENYTLAAGKLYCLAHFKQLFMSKGNYNEGFGLEPIQNQWNQHKNGGSGSQSSHSSRNASPYPDSLTFEEQQPGEVLVDQEQEEQ